MHEADQRPGDFPGAGYRDVQAPADPRLVDLKTAAESQTDCDDLKGALAQHVHRKMLGLG